MYRSVKGISCRLLQGYNFYREACGSGNGRADNMDDLKDLLRESDVELLKEVYRNVDDVDLYVGGILERPFRDSMLGPTFTCIVGNNFRRYIENISLL